MSANHLQKLNLGCGPNAPVGWLNLDGSWNAWFAHHPHLRKFLEAAGLINATNQGAQWNVKPIVHDLRKPLPFKDNTFSAVYASHVLEHLYLVEAQQLLAECRRVTKPGGVLRIVVPDLRSMVVDYLHGENGDSGPFPGKISAADLLNDKLGFRKPAPPGGNAVFKFYAIWKDFHSHKWMYDCVSLIRYLELAGLEEVSEKSFLQSEIPGIEEVEDPGRVLDGAGICVEGRKRPEIQ